MHVVRQAQRSLHLQARRGPAGTAAARALVERFDRRGIEPFELFTSEFGQNYFKIQEFSLENSKFSENFLSSTFSKISAKFRQNFIKI